MVKYDISYYLLSEDRAYLTYNLFLINPIVTSSKQETVALQGPFTLHETITLNDGNEWNFQMINTSSLWEISKGENIIIAVLDTGISFNNSDFSNGIWENTHEILNGMDDDNNGYIDDINGWDFVNDDNNPEDDSIQSHGTHVSGLINGDSIGMAPNSIIMPLKVMNSEG